jgi:hypothetical protein
VVYYLYPLYGLLDEPVVTEFSLHVLRILRSRTEPVRAPGVDPHAMTILQQTIYEVGADKPVPSKHQAIQRGFPSLDSSYARLFAPSILSPLN